MQILRQSGFDAACAEPDNATATSMTAINILIMARVSSRFPKLDRPLSGG
jgi:hypothetical protein